MSSLPTYLQSQLERYDRLDYFDHHAAACMMLMTMMMERLFAPRQLLLIWGICLVQYHHHHQQGLCLPLKHKETCVKPTYQEKG